MTTLAARKAKLVLVGLGVLGCSSCPGYDAPPQYRVTVTDAASGQAICDAVLYLDDAPTAPPEHCRHVVPIPAGRDSVTLRAEHAGYVASSKVVSTEHRTDSCGIAEPVSVAFALEKKL